MKSVEKIWNDKHQSKHFGIDVQVGEGFEPVNKLYDVFDYKSTTRAEFQMTVEESKEDLKAKSKEETDFYRMIFGLGTVDTNPTQQDEFRDEKHCGIPRVRFMGTLADWYRLKMKITYLDRFGCNKWLNALLPVVNKFIQAIEEGIVDKEFWGLAYQLNTTQSQTAANKVFGWVCNFFPYIGVERRDQFANLGGLKTIFAERGTEVKTFQIDETDFTRGIQICPLTVNSKAYQLASGFVGVEFRNEDDPKYPGDTVQYVKPAIGWFLYQEDPTKKGQGKQVFIAADTAGAIFN